MTGLRDILERQAALARRGEPAVLATVVQVRGSAYRRPGARMLIPAEGLPVGLVSGGCLEGDLAERAREVLTSGSPRTVVYDMRSPDDIVWGLGLGCNGEVRVLLERILPGSPPAYLEQMRRCLDRRSMGVVVTLFGSEGAPVQDGERLVLDDLGNRLEGPAPEALPAELLTHARSALEAGRSAVRRYDHSGGAVSAFIEVVRPTVRLIVLGCGGDAVPLVRTARELGWSVVALDQRASYATADRFPEADEVRIVDWNRLDVAALELDDATVAVVMTHHFMHDLELMQTLLSADRMPAYVGLLGPRKRTENLLGELESRGIVPTEDQLRRLYGPAGLDVGSETPEEIALSILAEIQAVLGRRDGGFLRDRDAPLHDLPDS